MNIKKVRLLENSYDVCGGSEKECGMKFIYDATTPRGKCPIFKPLLSNKCSFDCKYCVNSVKIRKTNLSFEPQELAKIFILMQKKYKLHGLFLSSAVEKDAEKTTEKMIETVRLIREKYNYQGYIHFKILPGTSYDQIKQATQYANRLSINIETPNKSRLNELSTTKDFKIDLLRRQAWIKKLHKNQTTQIIIGAGDETDWEILKMVDWEYKNLGIKRIYFSGFKSIKGIELKRKDCDKARKNRLYNIDFLIRKYNIRLKDIKEIMIGGMLPEEDPKLALARLKLENPIEINEASYDELLTIPGIGPKSAGKIIQLRTKVKIKKYSQLHSIGIKINRAKPFIKVDGKWQEQLNHFCKPPIIS